MSDNSFLSSVLLIYKGKVLLYSPDIDLSGIQKDNWSVIFITKANSDKLEETISRKVKYVTQLSLNSIKPLVAGLQDKKRKPMYFQKLTDEHVNLIERREGQRLQFFTYNELNKIDLGEQTSNLFEEYKTEVRDLLSL
jgi:hypothetical protein